MRSWCINIGIYTLIEGGNFKYFSALLGLLQAIISIPRHPLRDNPVIQLVYYRHGILLTEEINASISGTI
jgi:hypothetical protein